MNFHRYPLHEILARSSDDEPPILRILTDGTLPKPHPEGPWIAGGAVRRSLAGEKKLESDIDFFFRSEEQSKAFETSVLEGGGSLVSRSDQNATFTTGEWVVQAISMSYYDSLEEVLDSFDFTICMVGTDGADLVAYRYALWDIARKKLALHKMTYGVSTLRRLIKYTRQGYTACGGALADLLEAAIAEPAVVQRDVQYID